MSDIRFQSLFRMAAALWIVLAAIWTPEHQDAALVAAILAVACAVLTIAPTHKDKP